ncbi:MAG: K+/H+ antiporter subunit F [Burkholderiales bacterium]|nr:K+/H+ antiporter subunit F [Burkholderiales bacterium]
MIAAVLPWVILLFSLAMGLAFVRLLRGPGAADRILALDTLYINALALLVLLGVAFGTFAYFEVTLVIALLGFVGTACLSKYVSRGDIVE